MKIGLFYNRFTFKEFTTYQKNICRRIPFSDIAHLQKATITASSENVPYSQSSVDRRNNYDIFEENVLSGHI